MNEDQPRGRREPELAHSGVAVSELAQMRHAWSRSGRRMGPGKHGAATGRIEHTPRVLTDV